MDSSSSNRRPPPILKHVDICPPAGSKTKQIGYWEWAAPEPDAPVVVFLHATGFHGRIFDIIVENLPHCQCLCFDLPGHGQTARLNFPAEEDVRSWKRRSYLIQLAFEKLGLYKVVGVGHSAGGHVLASCAVRSEHQLFRSMILVDPVIFSPKAYGMLKGVSEAVEKEAAEFQSTLKNTASKDKQDYEKLMKKNDTNQEPDMGELWKRFIQAPWIKKRQSSFQSVEDFGQRLCKRTPYSKWIPRVQKDFYEHAVHKPDKPREADRPFELLCDPTVEFWNYAGSYEDPISELEQKENAHKIWIPVRIMRSGFGQFEGGEFMKLSNPKDVFQTSPTYPLLYKRFPRAVDELVQGYGHFFPQEAPALLLRRVLAYAGPNLRVPDKPAGPPARKPPRRARM